jgi:hypothetical protein
VERLRYFTITGLARYPSLAFPLARLRGEGVLVDRATDLVVESFPRCASSFALAAFTIAQEPDQPRVAHHTHTPANVLKAIRLGVPALVLIRVPEDVVISNMIRHPARTPNDILRGFVRFYEPLLPRRRGFEIASFDEVVGGGMGRVIGRLNARFGTRFVEFENTEENVARCLRDIDDDWRSRRGGGEPLERIVPRPSGVRDGMKASLHDRYRREASRALAARADHLYEALAGSRVDAAGP